MRCPPYPRFFTTVTTMSTMDVTPVPHRGDEHPVTAMRNVFDSSGASRSTDYISSTAVPCPRSGPTTAVLMSMPGTSETMEASKNPSYSTPMYWLAFLPRWALIDSGASRRGAASVCVTAPEHEDPEHEHGRTSPQGRPRHRPWMWCAGLSWSYWISMARFTVRTLAESILAAAENPDILRSPARAGRRPRRWLRRRRPATSACVRR